MAVFCLSALSDAPWPIFWTARNPSVTAMPTATRTATISPLPWLSVKSERSLS
jgi:hypothetical protein